MMTMMMMMMMMMMVVMMMIDGSRGGDDDDDGPSIVLGFCNTDKLILGSCIKRLYLPTHPPCYIIVATASS